MASPDPESPSVPERAQTPVGINHVVLAVRNLEVSHKFWTEIMGFRQVAALRPKPGRPPLKMRFYSGDHNGQLSHHDLALMEVAAAEAPSAEAESWTLNATKVGINHVAIAWPDRESWRKQLAFLRSKGVAFHLRVNHGMTHSAYISDPDGYGIEVLYELPREVWEHDIDAAQNYSERLPTQGDEAMVDRTENPVFDRA
jgi:catechol 2,3-dioxygenase